MAVETGDGRPIRAALRGVLMVAFALGSSQAEAGTRTEAPQGLKAGRWVVAPYFFTNAGVDDNLFRSPECDPAEPLCRPPQRETFIRNTLGVTARLPVRNSFIELLYQADARRYSDFDPQRPIEHTAGALFSFRFGSGDVFTVSDNYLRGASDVTAVDGGGELVFRDEPFNLNRFDLVWQRTVPSMRGFVIRVSRVDLNFVGRRDDNQPIPFFDYRGFESAFEYRHPVSRGKWLRVYYDSRRFNHYEPQDPETVGVPFRKEEADTVQVGMGGVLGRDKPFDVRLGYGRFRLVGQDGKFDGVVGTANLALRVGGGTNIAFRLVRQPLPSNFATYYIINSLRVTAERPFLREFQVGLATELSRNQYGDPLVIDVDGEIRKDQRYLLEAYFDWNLHPRLAIRVNAGHQRRVSNFETAEFAATGATVGLRMGWF